MRRLMVGMSQGKLGKALEVTSKQVQKYEKGENRIAARRLQQIARALKVPLAYFFDGGHGTAAGYAEPSGDSKSIALILTSDGMDLSRAFASIRNPEVRNKFLQLVEALAADPYRRSPDDPLPDGEPL